MRFFTIRFSAQNEYDLQQSCQKGKIIKNNIETEEKIWDILEGLNRKDTLTVLADVIGYLGDLDFAAKLVREDFEPDLTAEVMYENYAYDEGNDTAGRIPLADILEFVENILTKQQLGLRLTKREKKMGIETYMHGTRLMKALK